MNLAPPGFSSPDCAPGYCWQGSDFVNSKMPTQLAGVAATHVGGALIGPTTLFLKFTTPAKPSEVIVLYANGFGATSTPVVSGSILQSGALSPLPVVKIGGVNATVQFAGLVSPGQFQFNVVVPSSLANGDQSITAIYGGQTTQAGTLISIQN